MIINQIMWCVISAFLGAVACFLFDFFNQVGPNIECIKNDLRKISEQSESMDESIFKIEGKYLKRDEDGYSCVVGVSSEMEGNYVSVYKDNKLNLESGDIIFITNPYGKFTPTVKFVVYLMEENTGNKSSADLYVSRAGIDKLDITPKEVKRKGIFNMTMHRYSHSKNGKKHYRTENDETK